MNITLYHNPRCSKSRQTLALLQARDIQPEIIEYQKTPLDKAQLRELLKLLGATPRDIIRNGEKAYRDLGLDDRDLTNDHLLDAIAQHPVLMQRPIVVVQTEEGDGKARIGRPPEAVLEII